MSYLSVTGEGDDTVGDATSQECNRAGRTYPEEGGSMFSERRMAILTQNYAFTKYSNRENGY